MRVYFCENNAYNSVIITNGSVAKIFYYNGQLKSIDTSGRFAIVDLRTGTGRPVSKVIEELKNIDFCKDFNKISGDYELEYNLVADWINKSGYLIFEDYEEKVIKQLNSCSSESDHEIADTIIYEFLKEKGYDELAEAYNNVPKWFS